MLQFVDIIRKLTERDVAPKFARFCVHLSLPERQWLTDSIANLLLNRTCGTLIQWPITQSLRALSRKKGGGGGARHKHALMQ